LTNLLVQPIKHQDPSLPRNINFHTLFRELNEAGIYAALVPACQVSNRGYQSASSQEDKPRLKKNSQSDRREYKKNTSND
jgi:hypothetical protein